jgi:putative membrane protein
MSSSGLRTDRSSIFWTSQSAIRSVLVLAGAGSMVAASGVLLLSSPGSASAALKQGLTPALGVLALAVGLAL